MFEEGREGVEKLFTTTVKGLSPKDKGISTFESAEPRSRLVLEHMGVVSASALFALCHWPVDGLALEEFRRSSFSNGESCGKTLEMNRAKINEISFIIPPKHKYAKQNYNLKVPGCVKEREREKSCRSTRKNTKVGLLKFLLIQKRHLFCTV